MMMSDETIVTTTLQDGTKILVRATQAGSVSSQGTLTSGSDTPKDFGEITKSILGLAKACQEILEAVGPDKASVEFGVEVAIDSGALIALLAKGSSKANIKVSLEWTKGK